MPGPDSFSRRGAERIAATIQDYWADRGGYVDVRIEPLRSSGIRGGWIVRTDLVNGLPQRSIQILPAPEQPRERACLRCGNDFWSTGKGNRLCGYCADFAHGARMAMNW